MKILVSSFKKNTCVVHRPEPFETLPGHTAITIGNTVSKGFHSITFYLDYKIQEQNGNMIVKKDEYSLIDFSFIRGNR